MTYGLVRATFSLALAIIITTSNGTHASPIATTTIPGTPTQTNLAPSTTQTAGSGALLVQDFSPIQRQAVFWTSIAIAVLITIFQGAITTFIDICEAEGLWTLRFRLGLYEHIWWTFIAIALVASFGAMLVSFLAGNTGESLSIVLLSSASSLVVFRYAWPAWRNRDYCRNRWLAWTGPSRTGIDGTLVPYVGGPQNWRNLDQHVHVMQRHPVDRQLAWLYRRNRSKLIISDPTDLLKTFHALHTKSSNSLDQPSIIKASSSSIFKMAWIQKSLSSASLLWGAKLGFRPRVSRGILSAPHRLLTANPRTADDHDGRALCLAHGILARNKGLDPKSFILQLDTKKLEEKCVQWPRPTKVLRSYYSKEMQAMYGGLGDSYVKCATELALLLADTHPNVIRDWLEANLEHQDIGLNRTAAELGASDDDLQILYRLSYAAMLVSLSSHAYGHHLRPEMAIFQAYVTHVEARPSGLPTWAIGKEMQSRLQQEQKVDPRSDLNLLIEAVLPYP
ncbi:hypothetical protein GYMLUDRAFT_179039 [Collybiopsis luxurians FD-317 M1]|uniref:Unplaced genomic scaffold GYMLUscaffold_82, whole genome shotgun sequence n=1 Tax=Collybiopsis luxurians FD-317 M1 TaxID=944289 RepID=A0A0D0ASH6_9AGAR|nr:hypothetical protein GYMLUDRAFT_179039 [Collybiopsis luxurians FD-317 M1]